MSIFGDTDKWGRPKRHIKESVRKKQAESDKSLQLPDIDQDDINEDLHARPLMHESNDGEIRIFGKFTASEINELMEWSGIFQEIEEKGYKTHTVELQYLSDLDQRIFVKDGDNVLIHIRLKLSHFRFRLHAGAPQRKLLYIDWLMTQHPKSKHINRNKLFPGQNAPGLGIFAHITDFMTNLAIGLGAKGAFNIPEFFHDALLFHRHFRFYDPAREAFFRGLIRDLRKYGAREISKALQEERIRDNNDQPVQWVPAEMISILDPDLEEMVWSKDFFTKVVRQLKRISFTIQE